MWPYLIPVGFLGLMIWIFGRPRKYTAPRPQHYKLTLRQAAHLLSRENSDSIERQRAWRMSQSSGQVDMTHEPQTFEDEQFYNRILHSKDELQKQNVELIF